jgi:hypothetical protein
MPKGLKRTSAPIIISFEIEESAPNVFTESQIAMQLNVLDREVMVVTGCNLDLGTPDAIAAANTTTQGSLSTTSRTSIGRLSDSNVIAVAQDSIRAAGFLDGGVSFSSQYGESPAPGMEYLNIIATNDFFIQVNGGGNIAAKPMRGKLYCYRAVAEASVFAALTQSELLSA